MQPTNTSQMRRLELRVYAWGALLMVASALAGMLAGQYTRPAAMPVSISAPLLPSLQRWLLRFLNGRQRPPTERLTSSGERNVTFGWTMRMRQRPRRGLLSRMG